MSTVKDITGLDAPIDDDYVLIVTATFEAIGSTGSDWGASYNARAFMTQNSSTTYGDSVPISTSRHAYTIQYTFSLVSGYDIDCGLDVVLSGPASVDFYAIKVQAEVVKR